MNTRSINQSAPAVSNQVEISLNGEKFLLNVERAKELGILQRKQIIGIGQKYLEKNTGSRYILASINSQKVILINLVTGGHWCLEKPAKNINNLTEDEVENVFKDGNFQLIA